MHMQPGSQLLIALVIAAPLFIYFFCLYHSGNSVLLSPKHASPRGYIQV